MAENVREFKFDMGEVLRNPWEQLVTVVDRLQDADRNYYIVTCGEETKYYAEELLKR